MIEEYKPNQELGINPVIKELIERMAELKAGLEMFSNREVFNFEQARKYLDVSASYLYKLTSQNEIPCYKPRGKHLYFNKKELEEWLMQNRNTTRKEIEQQADNYIINGR